MTLKTAIIERINDNEKKLEELEKNINATLSDKKIIKNYPVVYIHSWKNKGNYEVYVGESNNIFSRTREHFLSANDKNNWQYNLKINSAYLYIIAHKHFNKSLTLDIENKLIHYLSGVDIIKKVHNSRGNPQNDYYPSEEFDDIFNDIWKKLRKLNNEIFPLESYIEDSAIFKASPLHKLTKCQQQFKDNIVELIVKVFLNNERGKLIFIEGEAGTGKTVLNSSLFYDLCQMSETSIDKDLRKFNNDFNCCLIINHKEQERLYRQIFDKLCVDSKNELVWRPTIFINKHSIQNPIDIAFIDEAHLLLTQGKQAYTGKNQLQDVIDRSKLTIIMFDPNQILTVEQFWEDNLLNRYRNMAKKNNCYFKLTEQLRIRSNEAMKWIDDFTFKGIINKIPKNLKNYEIKIFDSPLLLEKAIKTKAKEKDTKLSRLVATYDWKYNDKIDNNGKFWEVSINDWHKPWNYQLEKNLTKEERKRIKNLSWAEQFQTIDEIGSTFTIQGFDLNYVGVIIGPSVKYENDRVVFKPVDSHNKKATMSRTLSNGTKQKFIEKLLKNELRVLMTRGINGLYIYACDENLRKILNKKMV